MVYGRAYIRVDVMAQLAPYVGRRFALDFLLGGGATCGGLWLALEPLGVFLPSLKPEGVGWYGAFLILSAIGGVWRAWPPKRIELDMPGSGSSFALEYGDIFSGKGVVVVPVNEYFDGKLGDHVSEESLHGQFIQEVLGGQEDIFFGLTDKALADIDPEEPAVARPSGRCDRYSIGTVARVDYGSRRYLLTALSHTDMGSLKAHASIHDLWKCLAGIWNGIRQYSGGKPTRVPLVGSGLSGVGLPPSKLSEIIVLSFLYHTKENKVADSVTLVLPTHLARRVDLKAIRRSWNSGL